MTVEADLPAPDASGSEDALDRRIAKLCAWLEAEAPECFDEQAHTREGSRERVYWHYGYMVALRDLRRLMSEREQPLN